MSESETSQEKKEKRPSLLRNYISFFGIAIVIAAVTSDLFMFLIELTSSDHENAYIGLLTYIMLPSVMMMGLAIVALGMFVEHRRRRKSAPGSVLAYPRLDLNDPKTRSATMKFMVITLLFIGASAFGSYRAFEHTESVQFCGTTCHSVMKPEYTAYKAGAHARVRCVECHVGAGADWYVKSKLSGAYQLYSVAFNKYSRPIQSPVHNLRPAQGTCEQCHWPEKFFGAQMKVFNRYGNDEKNTLHQLRMLINVGGGSPATGQVMGIHWHMNIANEITYAATDTHRQTIPWVRIKDRDGNVTEYVDKNNQISPDSPEVKETRKMDCVDCHNRPAHKYVPPDEAMDQEFAAGKLDPTLPFLKREGVALLSAEYETNDQAVAAIGQGLNDYYRTNYPDLWTQKQPQIVAAVAILQEIYQTYFFPEMKVDWKTHPDNVGHLFFQGCFRCHDGNHVDLKTGRTITNDCNVCHTTIYDSQAPPEQNTKTGPFKHPVDLGGLESRQCSSCHQANKPFQHPVNLGDISMFQCVVCHRRDGTMPRALH
jgi:nitrate/TMAO reductase-like tetraheme cytochrome c subunit